MKRLITAVVILASVGAQGQVTNRIQLSIGGGSQYDIYTPSKDANVNNVPIQDARSYNSSNDQFNWAGEARLTYMISPLWGLYGGYAKGTLSGSSDYTYYQASLDEVSLGLRFYPGNLNAHMLESKWQLVPTVGMARTWYNSELFFTTDKSLQNVRDERAWGMQAGAELSYRFNSHWSMYISAQYLNVWDDGLDGWDYGSGGDAYLRASIGVTYRFTSGEKKNVSDQNVFGSIASERKDLESLRSEVSESLSEIDSKLAELKARQDSMARSAPRIQEPVREPAPVVTGQVMTSAPHIAVFFEPDSYELSREMQMDLYRFVLALLSNEELSDRKLVVSGHSDQRGDAEYNKTLREKRAEAVKDFLLDHGVQNEIELAEVVVQSSASSNLDRRVEVKVE